MGTPNIVSGWTTVSEVDPTTLAFTDVIQTGVWNVEQGSFDCDGTYMYIVSRMTADIHKYRISDWTHIASISSNEQLPHSLRYDSATNKLYVTSSDVTSATVSIVSVNVGTFAIDQMAVIPTDRVISDDIAITPTDIWVGSEQTGKIIKINKANFGIRTVINTGISRRNFGVFFDGFEIWTGWEGSPGVMGRINPTTNVLQTYQFPDANQSSPNEFLHIGTFGYFTHYHEGGTLTAIGLASPPGTPGSILVSDTLFLSDLIAIPGPNPGYQFADSIVLQDDLDSSRVQNTPAIDTLSLSDSITVSYLGDFSFVDTLTLSEGMGIWNDSYLETLALSDDVAITVGGPTIVDLFLSVADGLLFYDSAAYTFPNDSVAVGDTLFLDDNVGVILNSTRDGYLRRYLNDVV